MTIIDEIKSFGIINGQIKHGNFSYRIDLISNRDYRRYLEMIEDDDKVLEAIQMVCDKCIYRIAENKPFWKKVLNNLGCKLEYKRVKIYDFKIDDYPFVLTDKFIRALFKVLIDVDFFNKKIMEVGQEEKKQEK